MSAAAPQTDGSTSQQSDRSTSQQHFAIFVAAHDWSQDHSKIELLEERIVVTPPTGYPHSVVANNVGRELANFVVPRRLGQVHASSQGYLLPSGDSVEPDVSFVSNERWAKVYRPEGVRYLPLVPDLVVEVLSRSNAARDRGPKKDTYEANGVREYWLVDPRAREVVLFTRDDTTGQFERERIFKEGDRIPSRVLEGLEVAVSDVLV